MKLKKITKAEFMALSKKKKIIFRMALYLIGLMTM